MKPNAAWQHNSLIGGARMIQGICKRVEASPTATGDAKAIALSIAFQAENLARALATRKK